MLSLIEGLTEGWSFKPLTRLRLLSSTSLFSAYLLKESVIHNTSLKLIKTAVRYKIIVYAETNFAFEVLPS